jgi:predicted ester cyclase
VAFPDLTVTRLMQIEHGDLVSTRVIVRGTHTGPLLGVPPTGRSIEIILMNTVRIADGRVVEEWESDEILSLLQRIGFRRDSKSRSAPAQPQRRLVSEGGR